MTPLQPVNAFIPVSVDDEKPDRYSKVLAKSEYGHYKITNGYHVTLNNCTHWLREQEGYFLTKEELTAILGEAFDAGGADNWQRENLLNPKSPNKEQYISSLIK